MKTRDELICAAWDTRKRAIRAAEAVKKATSGAFFREPWLQEAEYLAATKQANADFFAECEAIDATFEW